MVQSHELKVVVEANVEHWTFPTAALEKIEGELRRLQKTTCILVVEEEEA